MFERTTKAVMSLCYLLTYLLTYLRPPSQENMIFIHFIYLYHTTRIGVLEVTR